MTVKAPSVTKLRLEAETARIDLMRTLAELQARLDPRAVARNAIETARARGEDLAERGVDAARTAVAVARDTGEDLAERGVEFARDRPIAAAGVTAAAVALIAHRPLLRGLRALFRRPKPSAAADTTDVTPALTTLYSDLGASL